MVRQLMSDFDWNLGYYFFIAVIVAAVVVEVIVVVVIPCFFAKPTLTVPPYAVTVHRHGLGDPTSPDIETG